jgi:HD-GYP domain-containing protein (c-di-GMP phosphodiesterase class II)
MKAQEVFLAILTDLIRSVQAATLYPETHHRVQEPLARLHRRVRNESKRLGGRPDRRVLRRPDRGRSVPQVLAGATDVLKEVLHSIAVRGPLGNVEEGRDIVAAVMKGLREEEFLIDRMIRLQARDDYTVAHSLNVCVMVVAQAARLDLSEAVIRDIGLAALLHDIGKELVPAEILNKPGKLDSGEFAKISLHPVLGATHLRKIPLGSDLPVIVCYEHHIRHDRSGYPTPRFADVPPPASLMTQIADVYDALRTYRPYRTSLDKETALGILLEGRGTEFEPVLLDRFLRMIS